MRSASSEVLNFRAPVLIVRKLETDYAVVDDDAQPASNSVHMLEALMFFLLFLDFCRQR